MGRLRGGLRPLFLFLPLGKGKGIKGIGFHSRQTERPVIKLDQQDSSKMKVRVDRELCIGLGNCVAYAPTVFALDGEENKAIVLDPASVDNETLLVAAESCPQNAVIIEDDTERQIYP